MSIVYGHRHIPGHDAAMPVRSLGRGRHLLPDPMLAVVSTRGDGMTYQYTSVGEERGSEDVGRPRLTGLGGVLAIPQDVGGAGAGYPL